MYIYVRTKYYLFFNNNQLSNSYDKNNFHHNKYISAFLEYKQCYICSSFKNKKLGLTSESTFGLYFIVDIKEWEHSIHSPGHSSIIFQCPLHHELISSGLILEQDLYTTVNKIIAKF